MGRMELMARLLAVAMRAMGTDVDHLLALARASLAQAAAGGLDRFILLAWQARPQVDARRWLRTGAP